MTPIVTIVGKSNSGKTTLIEKLLPIMKKKGYKVGTIKHAMHGLTVDQKGKDSWRHKEAGADMVVVLSPGRIVMIKDAEDPDIGQIEGWFDDMDIVLAEGFKRDGRPKIEVFRSSVHKEPACLHDKNLVAVVSDVELDTHVPVFELDDVEGIADMIEKNFLIKR